ncbi:hypothetical protein CH92_07595 [Stutzerimonas stutzeri]|uniref:Uncharacterized protein n=1 Tax=Stutzerimonas stutzeri TaxID=316 RepID=W8QWI1_STUST|nr:hypothetical protein [Stutzerimonas stutzeri]AHL74970.1 hypothetical protein CH92_07595 [Stutzerimonas stutzeri]MCQ4331296.1 hypothetical protein [Stutzerimonas stutzeri]
MPEYRDDKRQFHALRKHIEELLTSGAVITARNPLTLSQAGQTSRVRHGMLVSFHVQPDISERSVGHR